MKTREISPCLGRTEAAKLLDISTDTLDKLIGTPVDEGGITAFKVGKRLKIDMEELIDFKRRNKVPDDPVTLPKSRRGPKVVNLTQDEAVAEMRRIVYGR